MKIEKIDREFSVCKVRDLSGVDFDGDFYFIGRTDEEISLVCTADAVPDNVTDRDDGWMTFRIAGTLDFSLIGILSKISAVLAECGIGIFAVSTYNTDYILTKKENFARAITALADAGYEIV